MEELKKIKDTEQYDDMKKKMEELNEIAQKIGAAMYQAQPNKDNPASSEQAENPEEKKSDDDVVEGEVEENK